MDRLKRLLAAAKTRLAELSARGAPPRVLADAEATVERLRTRLREKQRAKVPSRHGGAVPRRDDHISGNRVSAFKRK